MRNIGTSPAGELLINGVDGARDIRNMKNLNENVRAFIGKTFGRKN
jgi:hypothetical protein